MTPDLAAASDRAAFLRLLQAELCGRCKARFCSVQYDGMTYCGACAFDELVLDLGNHGFLALPALAFSGALR